MKSCFMETSQNHMRKNWMNKLVEKSCSAEPPPQRGRQASGRRSAQKTQPAKWEPGFQALWVLSVVPAVCSLKVLWSVWGQNIEHIGRNIIWTWNTFRRTVCLWCGETFHSWKRKERKQKSAASPEALNAASRGCIFISRQPIGSETPAASMM